MSEVCQFVLKL